jgi:hypothetical protein
MDRIVIGRTFLTVLRDGKEVLRYRVAGRKMNVFSFGQPEEKKISVLVGIPCEWNPGQVVGDEVVLNRRAISGPKTIRDGKII